MSRAMWRSAWVQAADLREGDWVVGSFGARRIEEPAHDTSGETWNVVYRWVPTVSVPDRPDAALMVEMLTTARVPANHLVEILVREQEPDHR